MFCQQKTVMAGIVGTSYGSNPNETNTNNELNEIIGDLDVDSDVDVQDLFNDLFIYLFSDDGEEFMGFEDPANEDVDFESEPVVKKPKKQVLMKKSSLWDGMINIGKMEMVRLVAGYLTSGKTVAS